MKNSNAQVKVINEEVDLFVETVRYGILPIVEVVGETTTEIIDVLIEEEVLTSEDGMMAKMMASQFVDGYSKVLGVLSNDKVMDKIKECFIKIQEISDALEDSRRKDMHRRNLVNSLIGLSDEEKIAVIQDFLKAKEESALEKVKETLEAKKIEQMLIAAGL